MSDSLWSHGLYSPWNSTGQKTGVGSLSLLQGDLPNQGIKPRSAALQADSLPAEPPGKLWEDFKSGENTLLWHLMMDIFHYTFFQSHRINHKVNYKFWVIIIYNHKFINCNKCITLLGMSIMEKAMDMWCQGAYGIQHISTSSSQLCCDPKTAVKSSFKTKRKETQEIFLKWWICLIPWFWWLYCERLHMSKLNMYTLNTCNFFYTSIYTSINLG